MRRSSVRLVLSILWDLTNCCKDEVNNYDYFQRSNLTDYTACRFKTQKHSAYTDGAILANWQKLGSNQFKHFIRYR